MSQRIKQKWRPPLALVIGGTLAVVLALPILGIGYFRVAGNILGWAETAWMIGWIALIATAILGFLLWRLVLRPVYALTAHANAVKEGNNDTPLPPHFGTPEITALGQAVHDMASTLQDREAGLRAYTDHVTHELKSPLTSLTGASELLSTTTSVKDQAHLIQTIREATKTLQNQLEALRRLAAARDPVGAGPAQLVPVAEDVARTFGLQITVKDDAQLPIDVRALTAILGHLAENAIAHGATVLNLSVNDQTVLVSDNGPGIAPGNRDRIFDPFFTTKRGLGGTGMGLTIVRSMLQAAGGTIRLCESEAGTCFEIGFRA